MLLHPGRSITPWLAAAILAGCEPQPEPATASTADDSGARLYARHCAACHGESGGGDGPNARLLDRPPAQHNDARAMAQRTDDRLYDAIAGGGRVLGRSRQMPAFGDSLTAAEILALVRHIRVLCHCQPPPWSRS